MGRVTHVPSPYALILLALAAFRVWRLLALDTITDQLRRRVTRLGDWSGGGSTPSLYRERLGAFLQCPWCLGFWVVVVWWAAWVAYPHWVLVAAVPFGLSALVGLAGHFTGD